MNKSILIICDSGSKIVFEKEPYNNYKIFELINLSTEKLNEYLINDKSIESIIIAMSAFTCRIEFANKVFLPIIQCCLKYFEKKGQISADGILSLIAINASGGILNLNGIEESQPIYKNIIKCNGLISMNIHCQPLQRNLEIKQLLERNTHYWNLSLSSSSITEYSSKPVKLSTGYKSIIGVFLVIALLILIGLGSTSDIVNLYREKLKVEEEYNELEKLLIHLDKEIFEKQKLNTTLFNVSEDLNRVKTKLDDETKVYNQLEKKLHETKEFLKEWEPKKSSFSQELEKIQNEIVQVKFKYEEEQFKLQSYQNDLNFIKDYLKHILQVKHGILDNNISDQLIHQLIYLISKSKNIPIDQCSGTSFDEYLVRSEFKPSEQLNTNNVIIGIEEGETVKQLVNFNHNYPDWALVERSNGQKGFVPKSFLYPKTPNMNPLAEKEYYRTCQNYIYKVFVALQKPISPDDMDSYIASLSDFVIESLPQLFLKELYIQDLFSIKENQLLAIFILLKLDIEFNFSNQFKKSDVHVIQLIDRFWENNKRTINLKPNDIKVNFNGLLMLAINLSLLVLKSDSTLLHNNRLKEIIKCCIKQEFFENYSKINFQLQFKYVPSQQKQTFLMILSECLNLSNHEYFENNLSIYNLFIELLEMLEECDQAFNTFLSNLSGIGNLAFQNTNTQNIKFRCQLYLSMIRLKYDSTINHDGIGLMFYSLICQDPEVFKQIVSPQTGSYLHILNLIFEQAISIKNIESTIILWKNFSSFYQGKKDDIVVSEFIKFKSNSNIAEVSNFINMDIESDLIVMAKRSIIESKVIHRDWVYFSLYNPGYFKYLTEDKQNYYLKLSQSRNHVFPTTIVMQFINANPGINILDKNNFPEFVQYFERSHEEHIKNLIISRLQKQ
ncbi:hypothetical protein DLAC_10808 [Tieghemostelium lacteum]|uniref:SH3 domain-containing protein n=1 Tax=Tieghemostelium lacteum TaxID=361077 RepID=A0A151Z4A2_TIELA|nr:hypothetical protein DLAC_10808 [Tieghemostelium lacteum]|eukprot:KYQ88771.1 hypothetical protein DLAC_10808 [Tieghemostelium lacteum]